jgi:hypothetical protein
MADTSNPTLATSAMASETVADGPPPSAEMLARYPSLRPDGEFGPLRRAPRQAPPSAPDPQDPRWQAHQEAVALQRREALRLRNRYPSMDERSQFEPVPPDPADLKRYAASMPNGGVDVAPAAPSPSPKPAPLPPVQPAAASEAPAALPEAAATLPEAYAGLRLPEGLGVDAGALSSAAQRMAEAGFSREQAEAALALHAEQVQAEDAHIASMRAGWRSEAEKIVATPEAKQAMAAAMRAAPDGLREILDATGLGDHPRVIEWAINVGRRLGGLAEPTASRTPNRAWR